MHICRDCIHLVFCAKFLMIVLLPVSAPYLKIGVFHLAGANSQFSPIFWAYKQVLEFKRSGLDTIYNPHLGYLGEKIRLFKII